MGTGEVSGWFGFLFGLFVLFFKFTTKQHLFYCSFLKLWSGLPLTPVTAPQEKGKAKEDAGERKQEAISESLKKRSKEQILIFLSNESRKGGLV